VSLESPHDEPDVLNDQLVVDDDVLHSSQSLAGFCSLSLRQTLSIRQ